MELQLAWPTHGQLSCRPGLKGTLDQPQSSEGRDTPSQGSISVRMSEGEEKLGLLASVPLPIEHLWFLWSPITLKQGSHMGTALGNQPRALSSSGNGFSLGQPNTRNGDKSAEGGTFQEAEVRPMIWQMPLSSGLLVFSDWHRLVGLELG